MKYPCGKVEMDIKCPDCLDHFTECAKKSREQEKLEHEARLTVALAIVTAEPSPDVDPRVKMAVVKGICDKDPVVKTYLRLQGVKVQ